jgi:hypothetical protein
MIFVNISAVATSTTLTSMPVSSFHFGPEKLSGSSACKPASHTIVMVVPEYFLASFTARSAALSAHAAAVQPTAITAAAVSISPFSIFILVLPGYSKTTRSSLVHRSRFRVRRLSRPFVRLLSTLVTTQSGCGNRRAARAMPASTARGD